ncbi:hypothetical protein E4U43_000902 [Claviceps pusilla]|uniref:Glycoside hydrolase n=1 Tax=Claviceps pusilla TaxID=123648 RepID=A0A9P7NB41_9HYPO|nr:hypothetical protein E4U43_000902 [Claviceps pusilla]
MLFKLVFAAFLIRSACAVPWPPRAVLDDADSTSRALSGKEPNRGRLMPPTPGRSTLERRERGERVRLEEAATYEAYNITDGAGDGVDKYTMYWGTGTTSEGWPDKSAWVSFENMFENNREQMYKSCREEHPPQRDNTESELMAVYDGIQRAAMASGVDHRFILAIMMEESRGCVRSPTVDYGARRPGLMQDHNGHATCNEKGVVQYPCPADMIDEMILEAVSGTRTGEGLAGCLNQVATGDVSDFYKAARVYNSGFISPTLQLKDGPKRHCYASNIANRLTGWIEAPSKCTCDIDPYKCGIVDHRSGPTA